LLKKNKQV